MEQTPQTGTGSIFINLVDGTRQPISDTLMWSATIRDGRSSRESHTVNVEGTGPALHVRGLSYFNMFFDNYWQLIWDDSHFPMAQDRFFAYVDKAIVDDVIKAGKMGSFAEERNPGTWHTGATLSYKQTQFDVTNVQLTFHQGNAKIIEG